MPAVARRPSMRRTPAPAQPAPLRPRPLPCELCVPSAPSETGPGWRTASRRDAEYDAEGQLTRLTLGVDNGADLAITKMARSSYSYDEHGRLATVVYECAPEVGVPIERVLPIAAPPTRDRVPPIVV